MTRIVVALAVLMVAGCVLQLSVVRAADCEFEECHPLFEEGETYISGEVCCAQDGSTYDPPCNFLGKDSWPDYDELCGDVMITYLDASGAVGIGEGETYYLSPSTTEYAFWYGECEDGFCDWSYQGTMRADSENCGICA